MQRMLFVHHATCMLLWSYKVSLDLADVLMAGPRCSDQWKDAVLHVTTCKWSRCPRAGGRLSVVEALQHRSVCLSLQCSGALRNFQLFWKSQ